MKHALTNARNIGFAPAPGVFPTTVAATWCKPLWTLTAACQWCLADYLVKPHAARRHRTTRSRGTRNRRSAGTCRTTRRWRAHTRRAPLAFQYASAYLQAYPRVRQDASGKLGGNPLYARFHASLYSLLHMLLKACCCGFCCWFCCASICIKNFIGRNNFFAR